MKNLPKLTWLLAAMAIFLAGNLVFTGCEKDDTGLVSTFSRDTLSQPKVSVINGTLVFASVKDYTDATNFVSKAGIKNIEMWHKSLGFHSLWQSVSTEEDQYNAPGILCHLMNSRGFVQIEGTLLLAQKNWLYSIENRNMKLIWQDGFHDPNTLTDKILDAHTMDAEVDNDKIAERGGCFNTSLPAAGIFSEITDNNRRIQSASHVVRDISSIVTGINGGSAPLVFFANRVFFRHQRRTFLGWTVCQRTIWEFTVSHDLSTNMTNTPPNGVQASINNNNPVASISALSGFECQFELDGIIFQVLLQGNASAVNAFYNSRRVNGQISFQCTAQDSGITASATCTK